MNLLREVEAEWVRGRLVSGTNNWVATGSTNVPSEWTGTLIGADPGLVEIDDLATLDPGPASMSSAVVDNGLAPPPAFATAPFPSPLDVPTTSPLHAAGSLPRALVGTIDRGAYEFGTPSPAVDAGVVPGVDGGLVGETDAGPGFDGGPNFDGGPGFDAGMRVDAGTRIDAGEAVTPPSDEGGCSCSTTGTGRGDALLLGALFMLALALRQRARR